MKQQNPFAFNSTNSYCLFLMHDFFQVKEFTLSVLDFFNSDISWSMTKPQLLSKVYTPGRFVYDNWIKNFFSCWLIYYYIGLIMCLVKKTQSQVLFLKKEKYIKNPFGISESKFLF